MDKASASFSLEENNLLGKSVMGILMTKMKLQLKFHRKNKVMAESKDF